MLTVSDCCVFQLQFTTKILIGANYTDPSISQMHVEKNMLTHGTNVRERNFLMKLYFQVENYSYMYLRRNGLMFTYMFSNKCGDKDSLK